ncbi:acyl-CoA/acyl-ACP dehydrogenase [Kibdelosporangium philippinense]|uniref:Acyl-CoA/acyl-ACP dehydrogenase n=1 Tax=Kibdelosporangium philippinense TaxID=211113 RepID=A0ABS8ZBP0_9PSEU|nr:acyl-CoA dehydrogenase family protein [Kibdelosporangium philippinense]MCE7003222.1 acyl-CoA/acyl-ACP dehydrogenase [Kibdelosporangium philippinense]
MTDLDVLDRHCVAIARDLREPGLMLDADPDAITQCLNLPAVELNQAMFIPPEYTDRTYRVDGHPIPGGSCRSGVVVMDRLSYGDPGVLLAAPGPSLSGLAVNAVGDAEQRGRYFERFAKEPTWTFFALTEHGKGSAALELQTQLHPAGPEEYLLHGDKRYIGNGASAQIGVVFCRRAPGPFGIEAVLIDTAAPGFSGRRLPTVGLAGVRTGELAFRGVRVTPEMILGADRKPSRRGVHGIRETMLRYRPLLTAMAVGVADAVVDYVRAQRRRLSTCDTARVDELAGRVHLARARVREVAAAVDAGQPDLPGTSSAKLTAVRLAEEATLLAVELLGATALLEHPWLAKTYRDVRAFEFMDGVGDIHRLLVFQGLLRRSPVLSP